MNLYAKLAKRQAEGKPVRIGLIGAGVPGLALHNWQVGSGIAGLLARITTPYALTVDGPLSANSGHLEVGGDEGSSIG